MHVKENDRVLADGYGEVTVTQVAEHDNIIQITLDNGETAWTHSTLVFPLDS